MDQILRSPAFQMVIPEGWAFEGGVVWDQRNVAFPAQLIYRVASPDGHAALEQMPALAFMWAQGGMMGGFGTTYGREMRMPMAAPQVLTEIVIPRYRGDRQPRLVSPPEMAPDYLQAVVVGSGAKDLPTQMMGGRVRIQYDQLIEEIACITAYSQAPGGGTWACAAIIGIRARAEMFEPLCPVLRGMIASIRGNPGWHAAVNQIQSALIQGQLANIEAAGQLSRSISAQNNAMIAQMDAQRAATPRMGGSSGGDGASRFAQAMRGTEDAVDPHDGRTIELPASSNYAWSNALGDRIVTDDPNFNPNLNSTQDWREMKKTP
ncbi:MAG: hypothetical protein KA248_12460 [Kiritimatiellae bacterium]|nr:hypothetical protein [Kiritimatiellia bacterium]